MTTIKVFLNIATIGIALLFSQFANAQKISQKSSLITVTGTSPMHDWEMSGSAATFSGTVNGNTIQNANFSMPAKNLKSKKGKTMDNKAYEALKSTKTPNITFSTTSIVIGKSTVSGKLSIAGVTKNVSFPANVIKKGNSYVIDGTETIKLSDFGMERPGFMGIKTGNLITVKVNVVAE